MKIKAVRFKRYTIIGISGKISSGKDTVGKIIQYLTSKDYLQEIGDIHGYLDSESIYNFGNNNWQIKKFADKLKECVSIITGIPRADLEKEEVKNSYLNDEWNKVDLIAIMAYDKNNPICNEKDYTISKMTVRKLLQEFGTEVGRQIHPDTWINALFSDYKPYYNPTKYNNFEDAKLYGDIYFPNWIITDVRFPNELDAVKNRGGITIRVNRNFKWMKDGKELISDKEQKDFEENEVGIKSHPSETALDNATFDYTIDNNGTIEELIEKVKEILIKEKII